MTPVSCQYIDRSGGNEAALTAGRAGTSVTGLLGLLVATLARVVGASVDNQSTLSNH